MPGRAFNVPFSRLCPSLCCINNICPLQSPPRCAPRLYLGTVRNGGTDAKERKTFEPRKKGLTAREAHGENARLRYPSFENSLPFASAQTKANLTWNVSLLISSFISGRAGQPGGLDAQITSMVGRALYPARCPSFAGGDQ